jgi:hypothetical protein
MESKRSEVTIGGDGSDPWLCVPFGMRRNKQVVREEFPPGSTGRRPPRQGADHTGPPLSAPGVVAALPARLAPVHRSAGVVHGSGQPPPPRELRESTAGDAPQAPGLRGLKAEV